MWCLLVHHQRNDDSAAGENRGRGSPPRCAYNTILLVHPCSPQTQQLQLPEGVSLGVTLVVITELMLLSDMSFQMQCGACLLQQRRGPQQGLSVVKRGQVCLKDPNSLVGFGILSCSVSPDVVPGWSM